MREAGVEEIAATPGETPAESPTPGGILIAMGDNFFDLEGERNPTVAVAVGEEVTVNLTNDGLAVHNMHIDGTDDQYDLTICDAAGEQPCSDPNAMVAGATGTITFQFDEAGTYFFRCDFHPIEMVGEITVE